MQIKLEPLNLNKEIILDIVSEETLMEHYLGIPVKKGMFKSTLRADEHPTGSFTRDSSGRLIFKDFNGSFYGDVFEVVKYKFRVSYKEALRIIANDFGIIQIDSVKKNSKLIEYSNTKFEEKELCNIQIEMKPFSDGELGWWKQFNINLDILNKFKVFSCKSVFLNGRYLTGSSNRDYIFGYYKYTLDNIDYFRIYYPQRKKYRFLSNWNASMIQGYDQLPKNGDLLVITKSMKDVMTLYSFNIIAIAPNSETLFLSSEQYEDLKQRFKKIILFYDNDLPGIANMNKIRKNFHIDCIWIPRKYAKDISDFCSKFGSDNTKKLINKGLRKIYGKTK